MVLEAKPCRAIVQVVRPELDATDVLGALVSVVRRRDEAERCTMFDRQRLAVQRVCQEHTIGQKILEGQDEQ